MLIHRTWVCFNDNNIHRSDEESNEATFPELFDHHLRYLGVAVGTPEIPMIDHDHAIKLAAKCRDMSRQLDPHGSWPFMIEIAETIEELIADRVLNHCHLHHHDKGIDSDFPEPIIKVANF